MGRYRSGYVQIDVSDFIDEIDDEDLLDEVRNRKLTAPGTHFDRDYAERALEAMTRKRWADAYALLDRALAPFPASPKAATSLMSLFDRASVSTGGNS